MDPFSNLLDKLTQLRRADAELHLYGANCHGYALRDPLTAKEVSEFEARSGARLPSEFRHFVLNIGNGGAGPGGGLIGLPMTTESEEAALTDLPLEFSYLDEVFPHQSPWNDLQLSDKRYFAETHIQGTFPLADYGHGKMAVLVANGPMKGTVWLDHRSEKLGILPFNVELCHEYHRSERVSDAAKGEQPLGFLPWYTDWLDAGLLQMHRAKLNLKGE